VPPIVDEVLRSPGRPLDAATRAFMEPRFGHDFSQVRVHADPRAAKSARAVNAMAYVVGQDIVFDAGRYAPGRIAGRRLLAHELAHVVQQGPAPIYQAPALLNKPGDEYERDADRAASGLMNAPNQPVTVKRAAHLEGTIQRFSASEHREIGEAAYARAHPKDAPASIGPQPAALDKGLVNSLKASSVLEAARPSEKRDKELSAIEVYGLLVAEADNVASLELMEDLDRERAGSGFQVPILSRIWDWIGDKAHFVDLAARNRDHFHPHNFKAWQAWHWTALREMEQAHNQEVRADGLTIEVRELLKQFDEHNQRARDAIQEAELPQQSGHHEEADRLDRVVAAETGQMAQLLTQAKEKQQQAAALKEEAKSLAVHALWVNGFGDHFLTDAYAGGHIVTPRRDLLDDYTTKLLGVAKVEGVLHCASIPSLAWHDLDNKFGVKVKNRKGEVWRTYGDNYAHESAPKGEPTTMGQVVKATTLSVRHMWQTAAGNKPSDLFDVLDLLPAPELDPGIYPAWTPQDWEAQLRFAAGAYVEEGAPPPPNPKGESLGLVPVLSFAATCLNALPTFSYQTFVVPMLARIRQEYAQRFYTKSEGQVLPPTATPKPQASVVGHVVAGSLLGVLAGAGIGLLAGGVVGAVIGGLAGLFAGGFIGGLIGERRDQP
jgi:hypothetical protein